MFPKSCGPRSLRYRRLLGVFIVLTGTAFGAPTTAAVESANYAFDIPAENAETALRTFAEQADTQFVFSADKVKGVRTNALRGNYAPREALDRLVSGTELFVVQDSGTGALTVDRNRSQAIPQNSPTPQNEANVKSYRQTQKTLLGWLAALFVATSSPSVNAQEVTPVAPPPQQTLPEKTTNIKDEAVVLSPFIVSTNQDNGYVASNTLAGSYLDTQLADTPLPIQVLTKDFIDDIGALKVSDAIEYAMGAGNDIGGGSYQVGATTGNGLIQNNYNFMIRGYREAQATRDYLPTILDGDVFNMERIDISSGPNSTLFGVGNAAGEINYTTKVAQLGQNFAGLTMNVGSYQLVRGALDINRSLFKDKLAVRLNLMDQKENGYFDFQTDNEQRIALEVAWRPTDSLTIRYDGEAGLLHQNKVRPWGPFDNITPWIQAGKWYSAYGTGQYAITPGDNDYSQSSPYSGIFGERREGNDGNVTVFTNGPLANEPMWMGTRPLGQRYFRTSMGVIIANFNTNVNYDNPSVFPVNGNVTGPGAYANTKYYTNGVTLEQRIGKDFYIEAIANQEKVVADDHNSMGFAQNALEYDVTSTLPVYNNDRSWAATPGPAGSAPGTLIFAQSPANPNMGQLMIGDYVPDNNWTDTIEDDIRVNLFYHLDLGWAGDHKMLFFVSRSQQNVDVTDTRETNVAPNRPDPGSLLDSLNFNGRSTYIYPFSSDLALHGVPDPWTHPLPSGPMYGDPQYGFIDGWNLTYWDLSKSLINSVSFAMQSSFFDKSLFTTIGGRRDQIEEWAGVQSVDSQGTAIRPYLAPTPDVNQSGNTYTLGAVYRFPFAKWLSVYANKSTNFEGQFGATLFNDQRDQVELGPLQGIGEDAGLKFDLLQSRVIVTLDFFQVQQNNAAAGFNGQLPFYIESIWDAILNNGNPNGLLSDSQQANGHNPSGGDTVSAKSTGAALDITANLTKGWRLTLNVSDAKNVVAKVDTAITGYVNNHLAEWNAHSSLLINTDTYGLLPTGGTTPTVADAIAEVQDLLAVDRAQNGAIQPDIRPWNANLFTTYTFNDGILKRLTIGGGVNYRGDEVIYNDPTTHANVMGSPYYLMEGMLGYKFKMFKTDVKLQLNVNNLLNNQNKQILAGGLTPTVTPAGTAIPGAAPYLAEFTYYLPPRSYNISARFDF